MTRLPVVARITAAGALRGRAAACSCPVAVTVADVEAQQPIGTSQEQGAATTTTAGVVLAVNLDANVPGGGGPAQAVGASVAAYCPSSPGGVVDGGTEAAAAEPNVQLVLEWPAAAVDAPGALSSGEQGDVSGGGAGGGGSSARVAGPHVVRLRARNLCDGGSAAYATLRVLPPTVAPPPAAVAAQGGPRPSASAAAGASAGLFPFSG